VSSFDEMKMWDEPEAGTVIHDARTGQTYEVGRKTDWYRWLRNTTGGEHKVVQFKDAIDHTRWRALVAAESA
jgi:hypothetical protein